MIRLISASSNCMPKKLHNLCKCKPHNMQTIQCVNILCKAVTSHLSNQSDHDTRIWYHKMAAFKECPQAPFLSFLPPYHTRLTPLTDFSFHPITHLGACSQATKSFAFPRQLGAKATTPGNVMLSTCTL